MSSKRRIRRNACTGKRRYADENEARHALHGMARREGERTRMVPYRCKFCTAFHVGHPPARVRQAMRAV